VDLEEVLPYFGTISRDELPRLLAALEDLVEAPGVRRGAPRSRGKGVHAALREGARAARETGRDLFAFVA
jgi:hypothetical protein